MERCAAEPESCNYRGGAPVRVVAVGDHLPYRAVGTLRQRIPFTNLDNPQRRSPIPSETWPSPFTQEDRTRQ